MGRWLASCLALALLSGPALGCINDVELPAHEREFRSQYTRWAAPMPVPVAYPSRNRLLMEAGGMLLAGGLAVALFARRPRG